MITPPAISRFGMVTLLVTSAVLVLTSFWVLEVMRRSGTEEVNTAKRIDPDYFVEKFNFLRLSQVKGTRYNIAGQKLEHDPVENLHHVRLPVVNSQNDSRPPVKAWSQRAVVSSDNTKVHLYDDVHVDRPPTATTNHLHVRSEYLLVLTDEDVVRTDKPVEITLGNSVLHGTGMVANNATRQLELHSAVRASFAPPGRR